MKMTKLFISSLVGILLFTQCSKDDDKMVAVHDPATADKVSVDRFSADAGHLFVRDETNNFPGANEPIDMDQVPFITQGLGPNGEVIKYYNFDVQPVESAPIFVLFRDGEDMPVDGQLNIINVIPGDPGYNDFWHVHKVIVPADYVANEVASYDEIVERGYTIEQTTTIVNCPVVPEGSTANLRYKADEDKGLTTGWYKGKLVSYFNFVEKDITVDLPSSGHPEVPLSDILVSFNINPDQDGGGPPSGFMTETGTAQTHNVTETLPEDEGYSPLWDVDVYDNADFGNVSDWSSANMATILGTGVAIVNCPVVSVE
jgi:hypothetical protein